MPEDEEQDEAPDNCEGCGKETQDIAHFQGWAGPPGQWLCRECYSNACDEE